MSAIGDYIHYQYSNFTGKNNPSDNASHLIAVYTQEKIKQQYNLSTELLNEKLKNNYMSKIKSVSNNKIGEDEFFSLLKDLQKNVLNKAANEMVNTLQSNKSFYELGLGDLKKDIGNLQFVLDTFSTITTQITKGSFSENPIAILTIDMLKGDMSVSNIKETFRNQYLTNKTTFKVDDSYSRAIKSHKNEINKIMASLSALKSIQKGSMKNFNTSIQSEVIQSLCISIWKTLNRMIGFVSEDVLADIMPKYLSSEMKNLGDFSVSTSGTSKDSIFKVKTEDISLTMDINKMLKGKENGEIKIKLPGVSLKRTSIKNNNKTKIHIKTGAALSNFLDNINISTSLSEFYHAYADYNMAIKKGTKRAKPAELNKATASKGMYNMYNYFHAAMLPMALAGSLDKDDFAYFIVINDNVYNVIEIIDKVANDEDFSFISSNLGSSQTTIKNAHNSFYQPEVDPTSDKESEKRSDLILSKIRSLKINMQLNLSLT